MMKRGRGDETGGDEKYRYRLLPAQIWAAVPPWAHVTPSPTICHV